MGSPRPKPLSARVDGLEHRVDDLSRRVDVLEAQGGVRPASKGEETPAPEEEPLRCPGCHLPVEPPVGRRCQWCGFLFTVAKPRRGR